MQSLSVGPPPSPNKGMVSLSNAEQKIQSRLNAIKTFNDVSQSEKSLIKNAGDSLSKSSTELSTQLNKIKDLAVKQRLQEIEKQSIDELYRHGTPITLETVRQMIIKKVNKIKI